MNPRSYEATSDGFLDFFPAFKEPDNLFATSSILQIMLLKVSGSLGKRMSGFLDIGK